MRATSGKDRDVVDDKDEVLSAHLAAPLSAGPQQPTDRRRPEVSTEGWARLHIAAWRATNAFKDLASAWRGRKR